MAQRALEHRVENLERRLTIVEQIVPTLATKADLDAAIAPLATKAELAAAIAPLATKAEVMEEGAQTRRHVDVVAEGLRADIRLIAEGVTALQDRGDARHAEIKGVLAEHDRRLTRLEASRLKRR
jgi:hypothetical protein